MQTANVDLNINVICRHMEMTQAIHDYAVKKIEGLHLDYPRIIEARVVLDVQPRDRHSAEVVLFCANHITIDASTVNDNLYAAIDETVSKIARRMRKHKTRLLKNHRPRTATASIRHMDEQVFSPSVLEDHENEEVEPLLIHKENYRIRPLYPDEAITELELGERHFVVFHNQKNHLNCILFRRPDGDYGLMELPDTPKPA